MSKWQFAGQVVAFILAVLALPFLLLAEKLKENS
jgi:hypothetical protein